MKAYLLFPILIVLNLSATAQNIRTISEDLNVVYDQMQFMVNPIMSLKKSTGRVESANRAKRKAGIIDEILTKIQSDFEPWKDENVKNWSDLKSEIEVNLNSAIKHTNDMKEQIRNYLKSDDRSEQDHFATLLLRSFQNLTGVLGVVEENIITIKTALNIEDTTLEIMEEDELLVDDYLEVVEIEPETIENTEVPYALLDVPPIFPGCEELEDQSKNNLKLCFENRIIDHFNKEFNMAKLEELKLSPGIKKLTVLIKIDNTGVITRVYARATHKTLEKELERVFNLLPKMVPGMRGNHKVNTTYATVLKTTVE